MKKLYHIDRTKPDWKKNWLKKRKNSIGASEISAICGVNPYASPLSVYMDKVDSGKVSDEENIPAELGLELEPFMRKKFKKWLLEEEGLEIEIQEMDWILQDDTISYFTATLDGYFEHPDRGFCPMEIKTTTEFKRKSWTEDEVPDEYYMQVQHQLMITGAKWCYLIVLIGNRSIKVYVIPRNDKVIKDLRERGKDFWENFVQKKIAPAPDGSESSKKALMDLYPEEYPDKQMVLSEQDEEDLADDLLKHDNLTLKMKELKKESEAIRQTVMSKIGDAELMMICGRKITYKTISIPERTAKAYSFRKLAIGK